MRTLRFHTDPLPTCRLIETLAKKAVETRRQVDLVARLKDLRQRVSDEVRFIDRLFPEYTPHDEQYHLSRLFTLADNLLGPKQIDRMNDVELFILAAALYAHDWGMAVSDAEKRFIADGTRPPGRAASEFWTVDNDRDGFVRFLDTQGVAPDSRTADALDISVWREYVRQTHAFRSGARVRRYFEAIDPGLGSAVARVCESHWLDTEALDDDRAFPTDTPILGTVVNLRALAVYLRLTDLLDLTAERTPYVLWKYIAPRDVKSKEEWDKHRAVHAVAPVSFQNGRVVVITAETDDVDVYAALKDLQLWSETQFRNALGVMARRPDERHLLDIYHVEWRITTRGFREVPIRFELDRDKMLSILSEEIYGDDPYVFLRELLQNSIDAIRMRRAILNRRNLNPVSLGVIHVDVHRLPSGDMRIDWKDDGIGMDEYIVRNYLAVAGRSYYRSDDFAKLGLPLDPIARFGIGLLSCFRVADRVQIETAQDPYLNPRSVPLRIEIPAFGRYFRVEERHAGLDRIGTTVSVFVDRHKLPASTAGSPASLDVLRYLQHVAGFVEFPIVVRDGTRVVTIVSPTRQPPEALLEGEVYALPRDYRWQTIGDVKALKTVFNAEVFDLTRDFGMRDYEGFVVFVTPRDEIADVVADYDESIVHSKTADGSIQPSQTLPGMDIGSWANVMVEAFFEGLSPKADARGTSDHVTRVSRSARHPPLFAVFREGILVPAASRPFRWRNDTTSRLPRFLPYIVANVPEMGSRLDLSRVRTIGPTRAWDRDIRDAFWAHLRDVRCAPLLSQEPRERLLELARWHAIYDLTVDELRQLVPLEQWPVAVLNADSTITFHVCADLPTEIALIAEHVDVKDDARIRALHGDSAELGPTTPKMPIVLHTPHNKRYGSAAMISQPAWHLTATVIEELYVLWGALAEIVPSEEPRQKSKAILWRVMRRRKSSRQAAGTLDILARAQSSPASLSPLQHERLRREVPHWPPCVTFPRPFHSAFCYLGLLNAKHPLTAILLILWAKLAQTGERDGAHPARQLLTRQFADVPIWTHSFLTRDQIENWLRSVRKHALDMGLITKCDWPDTLMPTREELPGRF